MSGTRTLALEVALRCLVREVRGPSRRWEAFISTYEYKLSVSDRLQELVAFHWHPKGRGAVAWPHVHLGSAALSRGGVLNRKAHVPTGHVEVEDVLRFAIEDLDVRPLRDDWREVFDAARRARARISEGA